MRKFKRNIMRTLASVGAGMIAVSTLTPSLVGAAETEEKEALIAHIGETFDVTFGDSDEYVVDNDVFEATRKSIEGEDAFSVSFTDEVTEADTITIGDSVIDEEKDEVIAAAISKLESISTEIEYDDIQSIVWTVETGDEVFPVNTVNTEVLKEVYASIEDGSVLDSLEGVNFKSIGAESEDSKYVIYYFTNEIIDVVEPATVSEEETTQATVEVETVSTESTTEALETTVEDETVEAVTEISETESVEDILSDENVSEEEKEEVVKDIVVTNSGTTEISDTIDVSLEKTVQEDAERKNELAETPFSVEGQYLLIKKDSTATTIDGLYEKGIDDVITQIAVNVRMYDDGSDEYVGFVEIPDSNTHISDVIDCAVALNDVSGTEVTEFSFADNTIRIPKKFFSQEQVNNVGDVINNMTTPLKAQFMVKYDDSQNTQSQIAVEIVDKNDAFESTDVKSITVEDFDVQIQIPVATIETADKISLDDIQLFFNNSSVAEIKDIIKYDYDKTTGVLTIVSSPIGLSSVKIVVGSARISNTSGVVFEGKYNGISVTAEPEEGAFPDGTEMVLGEADSADVDKVISTFEDTTFKSVTDFRAVDVSFYFNGEEIEPADGKKVNVDMHFDNALDGDMFAMAHIDDSNEVDLWSLNVDENTASYVADEFSAQVAIAADGSNILSVGEIHNVTEAQLNKIRAALESNNPLTAETAIAYMKYDKGVNDGGRYNAMTRLYGMYGGSAAGTAYGLEGNIKLGQVTTATVKPNPAGNADVNYEGYYSTSTAAEQVTGRWDISVPYIFSLSETLRTLEFINSGDDFSNYTNAGDKDVRGSVPLFCSHSSATGLSQVRVSSGNSAKNVPIHVRVMALNTDAEQPYMVIGVTSAPVSQRTQEATGIYKIDINIKEDPKVGYLRIHKKGRLSDGSEIEVTDANSSWLDMSGAKFNVYKTRQDAENGTNPVRTDLTTSAWGYTNDDAPYDLDNKQPTTYYIKETAAPANGFFKLDSTIHEITLQPRDPGSYEYAKTSTYEMLNVVDEGGEVDFRIQKVGKNPVTGEIYNRVDTETLPDGRPLSFEGVKFGFYATEDDAYNNRNPIFTSTANSEYGFTNTLDSSNGDAKAEGNVIRLNALKYYKQNGGTFYIRELEAPSSGQFVLNSGIQAVTLGSDLKLRFGNDIPKDHTETNNYEILQFVDDETGQYGYFRVRKVIELANGTTVGKESDNDGMDLNGYKFGVYWSEADAKADRNAIGTVATTSEWGYTNVVTTGDLQAKNNVIGPIYLGVPGTADFKDTIYIKELEVPDGSPYQKNDAVISYKLSPRVEYDRLHTDTTSYDIIRYANKPYGNLVLKKVNSEGIGLEGAEFGVYATQTDAEANANAVGTLTSGEDGYTTALRNIVPGTYYIKELKAPEGYKMRDVVDAVQVTANGEATGEFSLTKKTTYTLKEIENDEETKGTVSLKKVSADAAITDGNDCYSLAGAEYGVYTTEANANQNKNPIGILTTNEQGVTNTISELEIGTYYIKEIKAPKGYDKDEQVHPIQLTETDTEKTITVVEVPGKDPIGLAIKKIDESGNLMPGVSMAGAEFEIKYYANSKWEGEPKEIFKITTDANGIAELENKLPLGTYTIQETKAPTGYKLDNTIYKGEIKLTADGNIEITNNIKNGNNVIVNAKEDNTFEIKNERQPDGHTDAIDKNTGTQSGVVGTTTITDTFTYSNLYENQTYTLEGVLLDKSTGKPLLVDGKEIRVTKEFTPNAPNGKVTIDFEVKTSALAGKSIVVGETLKKDGKEIIVHVDVNDKRQEVKFPSVGTKAIDKNSGIQAGVNDKTTYVDTVSYTNLTVGAKYEVTGTLMDKETGKALTIQGATASKTFTPSAENGTVQVEFNLDASSLAGKSVVVFEKLSIIKNDGSKVEVASHEDIKDGGQEVATPEIGTSAEDFQTKNHTAVIGKTTLVDTVSYKNLIPDKTYTVTGTLMDKDTGKAVVVDGKTITNSVEFTPKSRDGKVEVEFEFDTTSLQGKDTVFFEKLFYSGVEIARHEVPEDPKQKIDFPKIRTTAIDGQTENHTGVTGQTTIVDTVKYENLTVDQTYTIEGVLMDKATGEELTIDGQPVTATQEFTPKTQDGTVDVTFTLDASDLKGKDVVVFETLLQGKVKITEHKSINDKGQTVNYPEIRTKAINKDTQTQTNISGKTTIIDTVTYTNLTVDQEYTMRGKLVNKATGEFLKNENGEDIVKEIPFTPSTPNGTVEIPIEVDTSLLEGQKIVVFEKLYQDDIEVTAHEDINDIPQNTEVPTIGTTATDIQTGNHTGVADETTIVDDVKYTGLTIGQKYIVKGVLMDKTTGEPVVIDGKEIISEQEFVVGEDIEYTHPSQTADKEVETTEATEETTETTESVEPTEETTETTETTEEEEAKEDVYEPIEGVTSDGSVKLFYDLNARELKGKDVVVFETLYQIPNETPEDEETPTEPVKVISHEDITDEGQTVSIPDAQTTATDKNTTTHTAVVGKTTIVDEVRFTGLTVGEEYTFTGVLMDKETGEPIMQNGEEVTADATMVAETKDGSQLLEFEVDTELVAGRSVVAFEEVSYKDVVITAHKDIEDEDQTVNVPTIATTATGQNGKTVEYGSSVTIVDTVTYTNLTVGESYTMHGTMVDQNGNAVSNVESVPFVAETKNGSVTVEFVVDTTAHAGEKLVAFEELTAQNGTKITEHKDLTDEGQTVYVNTPPEEPYIPSTPTTPPSYTPTPNTGNKSGAMVAGGIAIGAAIAGAGIAIGSRKKKEEN